MNNVTEHQLSREDFSGPNDTIVSRFERQVVAFPNDLAIVTDDTSVSYRVLDRRANGFADKLASLPSSTTRPIVLFMKDEVARVAAMLGALKANRIFIALDPNSPAKWIEQVVADSDAAQIVIPRHGGENPALPLLPKAASRWHRACKLPYPGGNRVGETNRDRRTLQVERFGQGLRERREGWHGFMVHPKNEMPTRR